MSEEPISPLRQRMLEDMKHAPVRARIRNASISVLSRSSRAFSAVPPTPRPRKN